MFHDRTKHIEVHYHYVRERLSAGEINLVYVTTQDNLADLFTKALPCDKFKAFRTALGLLPFVDQSIETGTSLYMSVNSCSPHHSQGGFVRILWK